MTNEEEKNKLIELKDTVDSDCLKAEMCINSSVFKMTEFLKSHEIQIVNNIFYKYDTSIPVKEKFSIEDMEVYITGAKVKDPIVESGSTIIGLNLSNGTYEEIIANSTNYMVIHSLFSETISCMLEDVN